jgi:hypothetical protein
VTAGRSDLEIIRSTQRRCAGFQREWRHLHRACKHGGQSSVLAFRGRYSCPMELPSALPLEVHFAFAPP